MDRIWLLLLVSVLAAHPGVWGCSDFLLNATFGQGCMSGRTIDYNSKLNADLGYMPKGSTLPIVPIFAGCTPEPLKTKHAFAFTSTSRDIYQKISWAMGVGPEDVVQIITDGLNDQGLSVSLHWDNDASQLPDATSCDTTKAISAVDLTTLILASFSNVKEVKAALDPAHFAVVNFQLPKQAEAVLRDNGLLSEGGWALIHLSIHDAAHNSLVIEFTGGAHRLLDNPAGVLTNEPQLPQHYVQLDRYLEDRFKVPQSAFQRFKEGSHDPLYFNSTFYAPPGDHSSQSRFIRLAMLNEVAGLRSWPTDQSWTPAGSGPSKGLFVAAEAILGSVVLPPAMDDGGGAGSFNDCYTQVSILRDHANRMYYFRSPASPQWQRIDLQEVGRSEECIANSGLSLTPPRFKLMPLSVNNERPWYTDVSADFMQSDAQFLVPN